MELFAKAVTVNTEKKQQKRLNPKSNFYFQPTTKN